MDIPMMKSSQEGRWSFIPAAELLLTVGEGPRGPAGSWMVSMEDRHGEIAEKHM